MVDKKCLRALAVIVATCAQSLVVHGKILDRVRVEPRMLVVTGSIVHEWSLAKAKEQLIQIQKEREKGEQELVSY